MNSSTPPPDDSWESDAVWKLLDEAPPAKPRASFADDLVRLVKLEPAPIPWWQRMFSPVPLAGLATVTAAITIGFVYLTEISNTSYSHGQSIATVADASSDSDAFADLQDLAETEALLAAVDHLDDFSDQELRNMIGL